MMFTISSSIVCILLSQLSVACSSDSESTLKLFFFLLPKYNASVSKANLRNIFVSPYPTLFLRYGSVGRKIIYFLISQV